MVLVILVILVICQNRKRKVKIRHYNNKNDIFIIIVSKMTTSEIENDQNDLDQNDHVGTTPLTIRCDSVKKCGKYFVV